MPRFGDEHDVITQEIRLTMQSKLPIVPVLVDGASMPAESILPPAFASLSSLNAIDLRHTSFDRDVQAVSEQLLDLLGGANETAIERFALKTFGPIFGNSIARISGYFILLSVFGVLWGLTELTGAVFVVFQSGIRSLFSASIFDPETAQPKRYGPRSVGSATFWLPWAKVYSLVAPGDNHYVGLAGRNHPRGGVAAACCVTGAEARIVGSRQ